MNQQDEAARSHRAKMEKRKAVQDAEVDFFRGAGLRP